MYWKWTIQIEILSNIKSIEVEGLKELTAKIKGSEKKINDLLEGQIAIAVQNIANNARTAAPSDKGFLRNSIKADSKGLFGEVSVGVNYAPYVEFGTGGLVDVPAGLESYAMTFKGRDIKQVNLIARPFLFPAFFRETKQMDVRIDKGIEKILNGN